MEPLEGPPVSSPDPAIISSVEQQASSSTHAVSDMLASSPPVMTRTPQSFTYWLLTDSFLLEQTRLRCIVNRNYNIYL